jgi:arsenate reductase (thioredoxin)
MAEGFARALGSDVLEAQSAGLAPAIAVAPLTHLVMLEKDIDLGDFYPKELGHIQGSVDLIINMSGYELQLKNPAPVEVWEVLDPIGEPEEVFREVRDEIEERVLRLIQTLRSSKTVGSAMVSTPAQASEEVDSRRRPTRQ